MCVCELNVQLVGHNVDVCLLLSFRLAGCNLTGQCCESLSSALQSSHSVLRELHLSNNDLQDSGVRFISDGLKSPNCQLHILRYLRTYSHIKSSYPFIFFTFCNVFALC